MERVSCCSVVEMRFQDDQNIRPVIVQELNYSRYLSVPAVKWLSTNIEPHYNQAVFLPKRWFLFIFNIISDPFLCQLGILVLFLVFYPLLLRTFMVASSLELILINFQVSESLVFKFFRELGNYSRASSAYRLVGEYLIL